MVNLSKSQHLRSSKSKRRSNSRQNPLQSDIYEYQPQKEVNEHPKTLDDDIISNDEKIPSDDDEELDSDAAFEESDEERFAGFSFPKSRGNKRFGKGDVHIDREVDLDERDSTMGLEEVGSSEDYVDVLDVLDGLVDDNVEDSTPAIGDTFGTEEGEEEGEEEKREEQEEQNSALSAEEDGLETKRKGDSDFRGPSLPRKRRLVEEETAVGIEGVFPSMTGGQQLRLDDFLSLLPFNSSAVLSLKKSVKVLDPLRTRGAPLSAPLPQRTQDRLDREAAYEQTKTEAEHLSFPLQTEPVGKVSNLELTAKFKPSTELETAVDQLLKLGRMGEEDLQKTEELKMNHLSIEEVASRRAEIMKTRELMFRAEVKAKRISKIKSKTYRRLKRREKENILKERATLRHKSTGKWARAMQRRGEMDADQRQGIAEMLEKGEKLRRKIQGGQESSDGDDDYSDGEDLARLKARVLDELAVLKREDSGRTQNKGKSVFDMKFMQDSAAREKREVDQQVDNLMKELQNSDAPVHEDEFDGRDVPQDDPTVTVQRTGGRVSLRPSSLTSILTQRPAPSDASSTTLKSTDIHSLPAATPTMSPIDSQTITVSRSQHSQQPLNEHNPWLSRNSHSSYTTLRKSEVAISKESSSVIKAKNKLRKRRREIKDEVAKIQDDAALEISPGDLLVALSKISQQAASGDCSSDGIAEVEEPVERFKRKVKASSRPYNESEQRELVSMAFAGDNVVEEFEEAKRREIEEDAPRELDTSLPGRVGRSRNPRTPARPHLIMKVAGINPQSRADFGKAHVIISEKHDKKAAKYLVKDLPYPYTSKVQFERSLDTPIGREWNTRIASQRATVPKVIKRMGAVIKPLEKTF
ncbi:small-subunit processome [Multifurca ochricompacta]|uniref:Small-subunit processome n=1 Tax=Multifurca ochricompacta TaxID=376703 RepID=A0AAD4QTM2_9AGAM|nr:small-subunit processome [Multifurca ochricompacta]